VPGLRERNRARTRADIKASALRLISEQGYASTTVDQIARDADVSPSTFFRYFPTKEDAVLADDYDPLMIAAFRRQPPEVSAFEAFRLAYREVFGQLSEAELEQEAQRVRILVSVPELRDRLLGSLAANLELLSELVSERTGRSPNDPEVQNFAGAIIGVAMAATFRVASDPSIDWVVEIDNAFRHLGAGLPL
jgi:AcrR family transcriptional regulator